MVPIDPERSVDGQVVHRFLSSLETPTSLSSAADFNKLCNILLSLWQEQKEIECDTSERFQRLLSGIRSGKGDVIPTDWGGVDVLRYEHPFVEKYLIVESGGCLAYEKHEEKYEELFVQEGLGVLIEGSNAGAAISLHPLVRGTTAVFHPGSEHCVIALHDLIIYESSTDPKGMDQDLIFIYERDNSS